MHYYFADNIKASAKS